MGFQKTWALYVPYWVFPQVIPYSVSHNLSADGFTL
jgi:hypothetical protein